MDKLWCVNIWGPDDVHAMPDRATALERANELNIEWGRRPRHEYDPVLLAVVVEWPGTPESHAQDLARSRAAWVRPQECPASGMGHHDGPHAPGGRTQCQYCGEAPTVGVDVPLKGQQ